MPFFQPLKHIQIKKIDQNSISSLSCRGSKRNYESKETKKSKGELAHKPKTPIIRPAIEASVFKMIKKRDSNNSVRKETQMESDQVQPPKEQEAVLAQQIIKAMDVKFSEL